MLDRRQIHTVIDTLIREARIRSVSDIHITEGMHVWYRIHGCLTQARDVLKEYDIREVLLGMMNEKQRKQFEDGQDVDFAWQTTDGCRQRVNIFCEQKKNRSNDPAAESTYSDSGRTQNSNDIVSAFRGAKRNYPCYRTDRKW